MGGEKRWRQDTAGITQEFPPLVLIDPASLNLLFLHREQKRSRGVRADPGKCEHDGQVCSLQPQPLPRRRPPSKTQQ